MNAALETLLAGHKVIEEQARTGLGVFLASPELGEKLFMRAIDRVNVSTEPKAGEASDPYRIAVRANC